MGHALPAEAAAPLLRHVVALMPRMSQQELCNSMWAVAVMDRMDEQLWAAFCVCLTRLPDISPEGMHQVGTSYLVGARAARCIISTCCGPSLLPIPAALVRIVFIAVAGYAHEARAARHCTT